MSRQQLIDLLELQERNRKRGDSIEDTVMFDEFFNYYCEMYGIEVEEFKP